MVILCTDFVSNGSAYYKDQLSPWHRDRSPDTPFSTEEAAQAHIDANPIGPMNCEGVEVTFKWRIQVEKIEHREKYSMGAGYYLKGTNCYRSGWLVRKVPLAFGMPAGEWRVADPRRTSKPRATGRTGIEQHTHTKHGFDMWIVTLADRVERERYEELLNAAKSLGGWYSRKWGSSPAGFAFKSQDLAEHFLKENLGENPTPPSDGPSGSPSIAERFRQLADNMQKEIDGKLADRLTNTAKRQREAAHQRNLGVHLERTQSALRALADLHEREELPAELAGITSKKRVHELTASKMQTGSGYYDAAVDLGVPSKDTPEDLAIWALLKPPSEEEQNAEKLRRKIDSLLNSKIPGYFPTPEPIVTLMLDHADISPDHTVLEPSAGSGSILDLLPENAGVKAYEYNHSLAEVLNLKGYDAEQADFMTVNGAVSHDRIVMNPPFEKMQDVEHVRHAFGKLKDGGRLVSVMSPGPFFRSDAKAVEFRDWISEHGGEVYDLPENSFKESGTGVASKVVVINK